MSEKKSLENYLKHRRNQGISDKKIISEMIHHGWEEEDATKALNFSTKQPKVIQEKISMQNKWPMDMGVIIALILIVILIIIILFYASNIYGDVVELINNTNFN